MTSLLFSFTVFTVVLHLCTSTGNVTVDPNSGKPSPWWLECNTPYNCSGNLSFSFNYQIRAIRGLGYKSIFGPDTAITVESSWSFLDHHVLCEGDSSCMDSSSITWTNDGNAGLICLGTRSCWNISLVETASTEISKCAGSNSCAHSHFVDSGTNNTLTSELNCRGDRSCAYSVFEGYRHVHGYGAFSLYQATLDSGSKDHFDVEFRGFKSGYQANVICREGAQCEIKCYGTGCLETSMECDNCTAMIVTNHSRTSHFEHEVEYDSEELAVGNEQLCNEATEVHDRGYSHYDIAWGELVLGKLISTQHESICCRGALSCSASYIEIYDGENKYAHSVVLNGAYANARQPDIHETYIKNNGPIFCAGAESCTGYESIYTHINMFTDDTLYCLGDQSCKGATVYGAKTVICGGSESCFFLRVHSNGSDVSVYGYGSSSLSTMRIYCDLGDSCFLFCGGDANCNYVEMHCHGDCAFECLPDDDGACPKISTPHPSPAPTPSPTFSPTTALPTTSSPTTSPTPEPTAPTMSPSRAPTLPTYAPESYQKCGRYNMLPTNVCTQSQEWNQTSEQVQARSMNIMCHEDEFTMSFYDNGHCSGTPTHNERLLCRGSDYMGCVCNNDYICDHALWRDYDSDSCGNERNIDSISFMEYAYVTNECIDTKADDENEYRGMQFECDEVKSEIAFSPCGDWTVPDLNFTHLWNISSRFQALNESGRARWEVCDLQCVAGAHLKDGLSDGEIVGIVVGCIAALVLVGLVVLAVLCQCKDRNESLDVGDQTSDDYDAVSQSHTDED